MTEKFPTVPDLFPSKGGTKNAIGATEIPAVPECSSHISTKEEEKESNTIYRRIKEDIEKVRNSGTLSPEICSDNSQKQLTLQKENRAMASPLKNLFWWDLLMTFWMLAEDYKLDWAKSYADHIINFDIGWIRTAMNMTFQKLNTEHQNVLRKEYEDFLRLDKVCDWKQMCRGHEYIAIVCTKNFRDVRLKRSVYAWSLEEAQSTLKLSSPEILVGWKRPWEEEYINEQQTSGNVPF